jgi:hypothetical protein
MTRTDAKGQATPPRPKGKRDRGNGAKTKGRDQITPEHQDERTPGSGALPKPSAGDDVDPGVG